MSRDISPQCKLCRRAGEKLFLKGDRCGKPNCAMVRRPYPPGANGSKRKRPSSEFGQQLAVKQKIKRIYGVREKPFKKCFKEVKDKQGVTGDLLMQKLEMRLDNVIYRTGFAANRRQARQLVKHSHFIVSGKRVNIPSFSVKIGEIIEIKPSKQKKNYFNELATIIRGKEFQGVPNWLALDAEKMSIEVKNKPTKDDIGIDVDAQMVVEYYSR